MQITSNDFDEWRISPVTKEVFQILQERRDKIAHLLGDGSCFGLSSEYYGESVGRYREINDLLNMTYEDMKA